MMVKCPNCGVGLSPLVQKNWLGYVVHYGRELASRYFSHSFEDALQFYHGLDTNEREIRNTARDDGPYDGLTEEEREQLDS